MAPCGESTQVVSFSLRFVGGLVARPQLFGGTACWRFNHGGECVADLLLERWRARRVGGHPGTYSSKGAVHPGAIANRRVAREAGWPVIRHFGADE